TIEDLLSGKSIDCPPLGQVDVTFKKSPRAKENPGEQYQLAHEESRQNKT
ncbi:unnamed protein product, partial [marine sediment metagenome]